ncbi:putative O-glycosylation ligase, exosortase A system-associated [Dechloromonas sp. XY25]|uniref:O-glycosylation ligase, exosortase A system-associated n=1 Tax=Dechloromonas hankyongensis TaxID=2908002 RepID=A0ABS9K3J5_9RHOO|nr:putative O-glycosylation ligase, exosortase A system-associated [Dechloromonas hankyongensis]MCG2577752.1 putative O-glycosylation ligase, exosortase A system-associated [Dechloromonas hankyongensis]
MRDIFITAIICGLIPFILKNPRIGAYSWAWLAMMIPHRLAYGFARTLPFSQVVGIATLIGFLFSKEKKPFPLSTITVIYLSFLGWMTMTSFFAVDTPEAIWARWEYVMKIHLFLMLTLMLLRGRQQIEQLIWVITLSIGFYGLKGGLFTLQTGGGGRVWGPPGGVISGNNELGVALVMLVPFMYYLFQTSTRRYIRNGMLFLIAATFLGILGTQSRGALLALVCMAFFVAIKGKRPIITTSIIGGLLITAIAFMPDSWNSRMNTIESYDLDASAMSRVYTWKTIWNLAIDRPLVGAGFNTDIPIIFATYAPFDMEKFDFQGTVYVAHSIYFQALGEHGFPGLILYVLIGILAWRKAGKLAAKAQRHPDYAEWIPLLMRMTQASLAGFAAGGAFLSLVHFDLPYYIVAFVVLVDATLKEDVDKTTALTRENE